jgi:peptidyl-prolyl cis-trans isomerase A (cyclophilin A)
MEVGMRVSSAVILAVLSGCTAELEAERDQLRTQTESLQRDVARTEAERAVLEARVERLQGELNRRDQDDLMRRLGLESGQRLEATLTTTRGTLTCELWPDKAPKTVLNFVELAEGTRDWTDPMSGRKVRRPLYDGTVFHRLIPGFMIQGGDPLGNGTGGPGYKFPDEPQDLQFTDPGLLAMANAGPDTNGSQFFVTLEAVPHLNGKHTIFGRCSPLKTAVAIAAVERDEHDNPLREVVLRRVRIQRLD